MLTTVQPIEVDKAAGIRDNRDVPRQRLTPLVLAAALGSSGVACDSDEARELPGTQAMRSIDDAGFPRGSGDAERAQVPAEPDFFSPYMSLAAIPGPTPLFESDQDDAGNLWVVGGGAFMEEEGGEVLAFENLRTASPSLFTDDELDHLDAGFRDSDPIPPKINPALEAHLSTSGPDERTEIIIGLRHEEPGLQSELDRALATGIVITQDDYDAERDALIAERTGRVADLTQSVVDAVEQSGGVVLHRGVHRAWLVASVPAAAISALAEADSVEQIDPADPPGIALATADGIAHQHGAQIRQYIVNGETGEGMTGGTSDDLVVAIIEHNRAGPDFHDASFDVDHAAWRDSTSGSPFRWPYGVTSGTWLCNAANPSCVDVVNFAEPPDDHATNIAGIIFGDLTGPQIPGVPAADREPTSGFAREARAHFYLVDAASRAQAAMEHIQGLVAASHPVHAVNNSYKYDFDPKCEGTSTLADAANLLYLDGVAVFAGANNDGGSSTDCRIRSPGDAIGSFAVGAHMHSGGSNIDVRTAPIYDAGGNTSAWGGNASEGQNRSIVSMTAAGRRTYRITPDGSYSAGVSGGATSYATAVVTATAIDVMDHRFNADTWFDAPGALYALMLTMGDRMKTAGKGTSEPDHRWGVGRLRARLLGSAGMDGPWYLYYGAVCLSFGSPWDFNLTGANLPADVDAVKAAAYWYDHRHGYNTWLGDVNISLHTSTGGAGYVVGDLDPYDNKAWVFAADWPVAPAILRFSAGSDLAFHHEPACSGAAPNEKMKVYFVIWAEDSSRSGPTVVYDAITGEGVYPEDL